MFQSKKKKYSRSVAHFTKDEYRQNIVSYTDGEDILMFVSLTDKNKLAQNDMWVQQCSHIGLTFDEVGIGDIIGDSYEVLFVNKAGRENIVFMKELESNGIFC